MMKPFTAAIFGLLLICGCDRQPDPQVDLLVRNLGDLEDKVDQLQALGNSICASQSNLEALVRLENSVSVVTNTLLDDPYYNESTGLFWDHPLQVMDVTFDKIDRGYGSALCNFSFAVANANGLDLHVRAEVFFLDKDDVRMASEPVAAIHLAEWSTNHFSGSTLLFSSLGYRVTRIDVVLEK